MKNFEFIKRSQSETQKTVQKLYKVMFLALILFKIVTRPHGFFLKASLLVHYSFFTSSNSGKQEYRFPLALTQKKPKLHDPQIVERIFQRFIF